MRRLRDWLVGRYLPSWAVQTILEENRRLSARPRSCGGNTGRCGHIQTGWSMRSGTVCMLR